MSHNKNCSYVYKMSVICSGVLSHKMEVNRVRLHFEMTGDGDHNVVLMPGALGLDIVKELKCNLSLIYTYLFYIDCVTTLTI